MSESATLPKITVSATIEASLAKVWELFTKSAHITQWNNASPDWHTPTASNDLREGGTFSYRMESKDGAMGFDFAGTYHQVVPLEKIAYTMADGRQVDIQFSGAGKSTTVTEVFDPETLHSAELQQQGWQAILNNFKTYAESSKALEDLHFEIVIGKPPAEVMETMIHPVHYCAWTAAFNPTSRFEGSWEKDAKILFLGTDDKGETGGMVSRIKEHIPGSFISIEHLGMYMHGKEIMEGKEVEGWAGATENYTFEAHPEGTLLKVDLQSDIEFMSYFINTWPGALQKLKDICEG